MNRHALHRARWSTRAVRAIGIFGVVAGCPSKAPDKPRPPAAGSQTLTVTREAMALAGVAGDGAAVYAAYRGVGGSMAEARRGDQVTWTAKLDGTAGEIAIAGSQLAVAIATHAGSGPGATGTERRIEVRGDPGGMIVAIDRNTGARRWQRPFESTEWMIITSLAALGDELVVAGSFGGTLRVMDNVVTSGGGSDGFVARLQADGKLAWLVRVGGAGSDAIQGVAVGGDAGAPRIAIAGTFSLGAEIHGAPLDPIDEKSPFGDAFVAELDAAGARRWSATFGSRADDAVAGVAIDQRGEVIVAASIHEVLSLAGSTLTPRGPGDGLLVWYDQTGELGNAVLIGGNDLDALRAITAVGDHVVVGGVFSGSIALGERSFEAGGGDDAFLASLDRNGTVLDAWHVGGAGHEEITSLGAMRGGFIAGVAHTEAASIDDDKLSAPKAGTTGGALVVRGL